MKSSPLKDSLRGFANFTGVVHSIPHKQLLNLASGISSWLLWPVLYLFGALVKVGLTPHSRVLDLQRFARSQSTLTHPSYTRQHQTMRQTRVRVHQANGLS